MLIPLWVTYLSAGAYIAIMIAVLGVPQMLSSYFDLKARRLERQENEANTERRHQELLAAQARREEREEERRYREDEFRRREEELRRQEMNNMERRQQELMVALIAALSNGRGQGDGQGELIRTLQQTIEELRAENERLRQQKGNGSLDS